MKKIKMLALATMVGLAFVSCGKKGCTNSDADNYCDECKKDDGSCTYSGQVVFWMDKTSATNLVSDGAQNLIVYVDGEVVASAAATVYFTSEPACGANGSMTADIDLGGKDSETKHYIIKDEGNATLWEGNIEVKAKTCIHLELNY